MVIPGEMTFEIHGGMEHPDDFEPPALMVREEREACSVGE